MLTPRPPDLPKPGASCAGGRLVPTGRLDGAHNRGTWVGCQPCAEPTPCPGAVGDHHERGRGSDPGHLAGEDQAKRLLGPRLAICNCTKGDGSWVRAPRRIIQYDQAHQRRVETQPLEAAFGPYVGGGGPAVSLGIFWLLCRRGMGEAHVTNKANDGSWSCRPRATPRSDPEPICGHKAEARRRCHTQVGVSCAYLLG
jgi:hypothetical protein